MPNIVDLTFRHDRKGSLIIGKRGEYVCNVVNMLFNMRPGTDEHNPERGLYIASKYNKPYIKDTRDAEYEAEIIKQFTTYTDLIPVNVLAVYIAKTESFHVYMSIKYEGQIYEMDLQHDTDSLTAILRN